MESTAYRSTAAASGSASWYYLSGGKKNGPVDASKLSSMLSSGKLPADTRVWTSGMDGWAPASDTPLASQSSSPARTSAASSSGSAEEEAAPKRKSRWWIWLIVVLALGAVAAACFFLFFNGDAGSGGEEELVYGLENPVIFENDQCAFLIDAIGEKGDYLELDVQCVNKTSNVLSFFWDSTCINGSMFDPMWQVTVLGNSTMKSSITFPLSTLDSYNLLPADQIKFILRVHNEDQYNSLYNESAQYIIRYEDLTEDSVLSDYKQVEGYDGYLFTQSVCVDENGRPYYTREDETVVYFDELYDRNGQHLYATASNEPSYESFYNDAFGRPYYFTESADTVYYDGYGFAFYDKASGKHYFYDENGDVAYYGNGGIPEYYEGDIPKRLLEAGKPDDLVKAGGSYIVHKEFTIYPTGKDADDVERRERVTASSELVYWNGEKGNFIVLGGEMDEFKGYIIHTYVENNSDSYVYFGWNDAMVNGVAIDPDSITVLRPHSSAYKDIIIPAAVLKEGKIKTVERIDFSVFAVGENLSVPLYPIEWTAVALTDLKKQG